MKTTSFGFVDLAESFLKDALSLPPLGGGSWGFQRSVNFSERTGLLRIILTDASGIAKTKASIQARQTGTSKDYGIQCWTELPDEDKRAIFVLKESNPVRVEEEIFEIVDRLLSEIPERDQSVVIERAAPPPKSNFVPLIPEIQNAPAETSVEPAAKSFDSNQAFIDSLLAGNKDNPEENQPSAEAPESNSEIEASSPLPDNLDQPATAEDPAIAAAAEEAAPKAKTTKSKKAAK